MEKIYDYNDIANLIVSRIDVYDYCDKLYYLSVLDENDEVYLTKCSLEQMYILQEKTNSFHYKTNFQDLYEEKDD